MSQQRSVGSHIYFPTGRTSQTSQAYKAEAERQSLPTPQAQGMHRPPSPSTYTLTPDSAAQHSPKTPPRVGRPPSTNTSPSIDAIRALYRKYPDRFPRTPPQAGSTPPNAPVPPKYWNTINNASPSSPTPDRPHSRSRTISFSGSTPRRDALPTPRTMDPRRKKPAPASVDVSEELTLMYPDFGPGFVPAENLAQNLALEIISRPRDMEKWELPQRNMYEGWNGHGWKLQLVISYTPSAHAAGHIDFDFEPSIAVKNVTVDCSLAVRPRLITGTNISARRPSESYRVTYRGFSTSFNPQGKLEPMQVNHGIHMDRHWRGPILSSTNKNGEFGKRVEYCANIYVPIPSLLFSAADTRAFDIDARTWVSVANGTAVQLKRSERITLSQFGHVSGHDDSTMCVLTG